MLSLYIEPEKWSRGVRLWAVALDGSGRRWSKWYEDEARALFNAEAMQLTERIHLEPTEWHARPYLVKLLNTANMDEAALQEWKQERK